MAKRRRKHPPGVSPRWASDAINTGTQIDKQFIREAQKRVTGWSFMQATPVDAVSKHADYYMSQEFSSNRRVLVLKSIEKAMLPTGMVELISNYNRVKLFEHRDWSHWLYFSGPSWHIVFDSPKVIKISARYPTREVALSYWRTDQVWYLTTIDTPPTELPSQS